MCKFVAKGQSRRINPALPSIPSLNIWREKRNLAHLTKRELKHARIRQWNRQGPQSLHQQLHRTLNLRITRPRAIKFFACEEVLHEWPEFVVSVPQLACKRIDQLRFRIVIGEEFPDLCSDKPRALRLGDDEIDDLITGPRADISHEGFQAGIELSHGKS